MKAIILKYLKFIAKTCNNLTTNAIELEKTHIHFFFYVLCNRMQKQTLLHKAFKGFYTVLQLQMSKYNFNVVSTLIWRSPIILIENEIMMQRSRH